VKTKSRRQLRNSKLQLHEMQATDAIGRPDTVPRAEINNPEQKSTSKQQLPAAIHIAPTSARVTERAVEHRAGNYSIAHRIIAINLTPSGSV